jgi:hypothetical protein
LVVFGIGSIGWSILLYVGGGDDLKFSGFNINAYFAFVKKVVSFSLFSQRPVASISSKKVDVGGRVNLVYKIELKKNSHIIKKYFTRS